MKTLEVLEVFSINIVCNKLTLNNISSSIFVDLNYRL